MVSRPKSLASSGISGDQEPQPLRPKLSGISPVRVHLPSNPLTPPRQIQDARNHVNQALLLLGSHDESYRFKTGAEVNKVSASADGGETSLLHPHWPRLPSPSFPGAAHGCRDAPADQSEEPPHHAGLHDAARTGH